MHENELSGLAYFLYHDNLLTIAQAKNAIQQAAQQHLALTTYLVRNKILSSAAILACCRQHFSIEEFNLETFVPSLKHSLLSPELICRHHVLPLNDGTPILQLGIADPGNEVAVATIRFQTGLSIQPLLVDEALLDELITTHYQPHFLYSKLQTSVSSLITTEEPNTNTLLQLEEEPVSAYVQHLLEDAINKQASDIHLEPCEQHYRIRFRQDGILQETTHITLPLAARILTRLKLLSNLNIAERRIPQDGRLHLTSPANIDIRVNTCPTLQGEKMALRIFNTQTQPPNIHELGLTTEQQTLFLSQLAQPQGLILVTGPTGSGKTLTLYAALNHLNIIEKNIATVEDPIEIMLPGINQVSVNPQQGLSFSALLKTLLRQDPDIIMLGEIRDPETAAIALQAAQTGHLVLSTLHTNSAADTIMRLQSLGVPAHTLVSAVSLIIAQRLVRRRTTQGYEGRTGIFEFMPMTSELAQLICNQADATTIKHYMQQSHYVLLQDAAQLKIQTGITDHNEVVRVLGNQERAA